MDLTKELSQKVFELPQILWGKKVVVQVRLPDLGKLPVKVTGDWGPSYEYLLSAQECLRVSYDNEVRELRQKTLMIDSPVLSLQREREPFFFTVSDHDLGLRFTVRLDSTLRLSSHDVEMVSSSSPAVSA